MFGDGATNIGYFHEALNLSKVWDLPVLWVCENNQYGMGTTVERASAVSEIRQKAEGYGIPNERVDGMDVLKVKEAAEKALMHIARWQRSLLPGDHHLPLPRPLDGRPRTLPRSRRDQEVAGEDPIGILLSIPGQKQKATEAEWKRSTSRLRSKLQKRLNLPKAAPDPAPEELFKDIYVEVEG